MLSALLCSSWQLPRQIIPVDVFQLSGHCFCPRIPCSYSVKREATLVRSLPGSQPSVVCQIQRFDFDCNLVGTRKLIIQIPAGLGLNPLYIYIDLATAVYIVLNLTVLHVVHSIWFDAGASSIANIRWQLLWVCLW